VPARLAPLAERAVPPNTIAQSSSAPLASASPAFPAPASPSPASPSPASNSPAPASPGDRLQVADPPGAGSPGAASGSAQPTDSAATSRPASPAAQGDSHALTEPVVPPTQAAAATTMPLVNAAPTQPAATQPRIVLSATADAWMEVRDRSGQVLLNRVLHPGETWPVPPQPNLLLTLGNAGGTDILVDGLAVPSLGASGAVRHDIPLDPDLLKAGKIPSAALPMTTASSDPPAAPQTVPPAAAQGSFPGAPRFGRQ
jgi:cytoskeleton protein RodZ